MRNAHMMISYRTSVIFFRKCFTKDIMELLGVYYDTSNIRFRDPFAYDPSYRLWFKSPGSLIGCATDG
jgi:hypothetical protein